MPNCARLRRVGKISMSNSVLGQKVTLGNWNSALKLFSFTISNLGWVDICTRSLREKKVRAENVNCLIFSFLEGQKPNFHFFSHVMFFPPYFLLLRLFLRFSTFHALGFPIHPPWVVGVGVPGRFFHPYPVLRVWISFVCLFIQDSITDRNKLSFQTVSFCRFVSQKSFHSQKMEHIPHLEKWEEQKKTEKKMPRKKTNFA